LKILKDKYDSKQIEACWNHWKWRHIAASLLGGDAVKNEIIHHAIASLYVDKDVRTIIE
jgi:hypothetical protein